MSRLLFRVAATSYIIYHFNDIQFFFISLSIVFGWNDINVYVKDNQIISITSRQPAIQLSKEKGQVAVT